MDEEERLALELARARARARSRALDRRVAQMQLVAIVVISYAYLNRKRIIRSEYEAPAREFGLHSRQKRCTRDDIAMPEDSDWHRFQSQERTDEAWYSYLNTPKACFEDMVNLCKDIWKGNALRDENGTPRPCDLKKRHLNCSGTIALVLFYFTKQATIEDIGTKNFGLIYSVCQKYLDFGVRILTPVLREDVSAAIFWDLTNIDYLEACAERFNSYEPHIRMQNGKKVVGVLDGLRIRIGSTDGETNYSGEKKAYLRKYLLLFDPFGKIVAAVWNIHGTCHESNAALYGGLYDLINQLPEEYCVLADSAYRGWIDNSKILRVLKSSEYLPPDMTAEELREREAAITRCRQSVEWGNNCFKQHIRRLDNKLGYDDENNSELMELAILIYNFRLPYTDRNQVKRFFQNLMYLQEHPDIAEHFAL